MRRKYTKMSTLALSLQWDTNYCHVYILSFPNFLQICADLIIKQYYLGLLNSIFYRRNFFPFSLSVSPSLSLLIFCLYSAFHFSIELRYLLIGNSRACREIPITLPSPDVFLYIFSHLYVHAQIIFF